MESQEIMTLAGADINQESRLVMRAVKQLLLDRVPIHPVVPGAHGIAHEEIEVFENLRDGAKEFKSGHFGLEGELHEAVAGVGWALVAIFFEVLGCLLGSPDNHFAAVNVSIVKSMQIVSTVSYIIRWPAAISSVAIACVTGDGSHCRSPASLTTPTEAKGRRIRTDGELIQFMKFAPV